jgi:transposase
LADLHVALQGIPANSPFPLITNDRQLPDAEVLIAYRYQPNLERRHHLLKSVQDADPIWLRDPARIEAILCCQFLALLVGALIERQIRTAMHQADKKSIPSTPSYASPKPRPQTGSSPSSPT